MIHHPDFIFPGPESVYHEIKRCRAKEQMVAGPAGTAKTIHLSMRSHSLACHIPDMRIAVVRAVMEDLKTSFCVTFEDKIVGQDVLNKKSFVRKHGGKSGREYHYRNGSKIFLIGLDKNSGKLMGSEWDVIQALQLEQINKETYEKAVQRANGRAGHLKDKYGTAYGIVMADINPDAENHWLLKRKKEYENRRLCDVDPTSDDPRIALKWWDTQLHDNPMAFHNNEWTAWGKQARAENEMISGVDYQRLVLGHWTGTEGVVFDMTKDKYILYDLPDLDDDEWTHFRGIDFGKHRFVCTWFAYSKARDLLILYREYRKSLGTIDYHAARIKEYTTAPVIKASISDWSEDERDLLHKAGIRTVNARKKVKEGTYLLYQKILEGKFKIYAGILDGMPQCDIMEKEGHCMSIFQEFQKYRYKPAHLRTGKNPKEDDLPMKEGVDDAIDTAKYVASHIWIKPKVFPRNLFSKAA